MTRKITLYAEADPPARGNKIQWSLDDRKVVKKGRLKTIDFPRHSGKHDVTIELTDNTGKGLRFKTADPIWVWEGGSCPPPPGSTSAEIPRGSISCTDSTLKFTNLNETECLLTYQLNFVDGEGKDANPQLDPEFKNGGGTGGSGFFAASNIVTCAVIGAAAVAAAAALWSMR